MTKLKASSSESQFVALIYTCLLSFNLSFGLTHYQYYRHTRFQSNLHKLPSINNYSPCRKCRTSPLMYFDDKSRYSAPWQQDGDDLSDWTFDISPRKKRELQQKAMKDKISAVRRLVGSYDEELIGQLSTEEVKERMYMWAKDTGVVGSEFGNEVYTSILWMNVLEEDKIPGVLGGFWQAIMDVITIGQICDDESIDWKNDENSDCNTQDKVYMIVLPKCPDLYDYNTMAKLHRAIEYCQDFCSHFGKKFTLTHFHPSYLNAPRMFHPANNSPFPCFGLQFKPVDDEMDKLENLFDLVEEDLNHDELLEEQKYVLESLFNSASVTPSTDVFNGKMTHNLDDLSDREIIQITSKWLKEHKFANFDTDIGHLNKALELSDFIYDWKVIYDESAEEIYTHLWQTVSSLLLKSEKENNNGNKKTFSTMLILPKFEVFSSERFKRFAVSVNASLRLFVGNRITLEIFHPEYLGKKRDYDDLRRAPYPSIQISYHIE